ERILGVRLPAIRALAKEAAGTPQAAELLAVLPHDYHEENLLHGFLVERVRGFGECLAEVERFLPFVDNWAVCDCVTPKALKKDLPRLEAKAREWLASERPYTVRYGMRMLMAFFLDEAFKPEYPALVASVESDEYYVKMMAAWYFATALAKQYEAALPFIERGLPDKWTHNKAIQKACESFRVSDERKAYLRTLRK
ncbi:MAG: DNA alkylation repair protein, partial [Clostridia bacterium]|nr:DNA alkylation repair protein [Clostridia bacterium]